MDKKAEKMELVLLNPSEEGFLQHIEWNNTEIKEKVEQMMSAYTDVEYTEDMMKQAKEDRAFLNKFAKSIDERRKIVKNKCMEPYEKFEKEVKEVLDLIKKPAGIIDTQIKSFEDVQKKQKEEKLRAVYKENVGDLAEVLPFEKVFVAQYLNATFLLKKATDEITAKIEKVRTDLQTIDSIESKYKLNAKDVYIKTLDLSQALAENKRLQDLEAKLEAERIKKEQEEADRKRKEEVERKRKEEERQAALETQKKQKAEQSVGKPEENVGRVTESVTKTSESVTNSQESVKNTQESVTVPGPIVPEQAKDVSGPKPEKKYKATFCAIGTLAQLESLKDFMKREGIEFGKAGK